jgi:hypothetical protein
MKIVFDRVESLKPWGLLLGEEEKAVLRAAEVTADTSDSASG